MMTDEDETEDIGVEITRFVRNGVEYPQKSVGSCIVCNHPDRLAIETLYMQGRRPTRIMQMLGNADTINSAQNITTHFQRGHVAPNKELVVSTMLAKAQDQGISLGEWEEGQRQEILVTEMVVNKFRGRLLEEDFVPDFKEGLAAAKLLYEMNSGVDTSFDPTDMYVALSVFMAHTRSVIAAYAGEDVIDAMGTLSKLLQSDPLLKNLISKTKSEELSPMIDAVDDDEEDNIFDGEIVEPRINGTPTSSEEEIPFDEIDPDD